MLLWPYIIWPIIVLCLLLWPYIIWPIYNSSMLALMAIYLVVKHVLSCFALITLLITVTICITSPCCVYLFYCYLQFSFLIYTHTCIESLCHFCALLYFHEHDIFMNLRPQLFCCMKCLHLQNVHSGDYIAWCWSLLSPCYQPAACTTEKMTNCSIHVPYMTIPFICHYLQRMWTFYTAEY